MRPSGAGMENIHFDIRIDMKSNSLEHCTQLEAFVSIVYIMPTIRENIYVCKQCNYSCTRAGNLKRHMLTHSGEKPFSCKQCEFSCTQAVTLKRHMLTHSGQKPFNCAQCKYSCTRASHLKTHMLTHSGEKPFSCYQCNYSSNQAQNRSKIYLLNDRTRIKHLGDDCKLKCLYSALRAQSLVMYAISR